MTILIITRAKILATAKLQWNAYIPDTLGKAYLN